MNKWLLVGLLWGAATLNYLDRQVVFSLLPLLERDLHATSVQLGLISSAFLWTYGVLSPFGGFIADRIGRVRVILGSLVVWSVATWFTGHVTTIHQMLWARGLIGASEAFYLPAALALIADRHDERSRSLATGLHQSGLYTGLVIGGVWGGWMGQTSGWRPVFTILGLAGVAYFLVLVLLLRGGGQAKSAADFAGSMLELWRNVSFRFILAGFVATALANWLVYTWLPLFLYERFGLSLTGAGFSATFYIQAASYLGVVTGGIFADRWSRVVPRARIYTQVGGMLIGAPFLAAIGLANSMPLVICALVIYGLGRGFYDCNTMPVLREAAGSSRSATGYGVLNMAGCIVGGLAVAAAGYLRQHLGLAAAFQAAAVVFVLGAAALARVRVSKQTGKGQEA